jgi:hypothetical protein
MRAKRFKKQLEKYSTHGKTVRTLGYRIIFHKPFYTVSHRVILDLPNREHGEQDGTDNTDAAGHSADTVDRVDRSARRHCDTNRRNCASVLVSLGKEEKTNDLLN